MLPIALLLFSPIFFIAIGLRLLRLFKLDPDLYIPACYSLGLMLYLLAVFVLKSIGAPWYLASLAPFVFSLWPLQDVRRAVVALRPTINANFILWLLVHVAIAIGILQVSENISTQWVSNYGDVAFHIGMLTSFVFGENIPPEYHIFPPERLSYPFFVNLWTASVWWIQPTFKNLSTIFLLQWMTVWTVVYASLRGNKNRLIPWALLFGGGSFAAIVVALTEEPNLLGGSLFSTLISRGFPWTSFLGSIWVTQRSALLGLCVFLPAVSLFHEYLDDSDSNRAADPRLLISGILLALSPLAHGHFFLTAVLYIGLVLLLRFILTGKRHHLLAGISFGCCLLPACLFLPWLLQKTSILQISYGWMPGTSAAALSAGNSVLQSGAMWLYNAPLWILLVLGLVLYRTQRLPIASLVIVFVLANFIQIAVWEFDQIKIFIALYCISLMLIPHSNYFFKSALIALLIPGIVDCAKVLYRSQDYEVYSADRIEKALAIRKITAPNAVILARPDHNSLVTLSGRRLFLGYDGTLHSHGLDFKQRQLLNENLDQAISCKVTEAGICPQYLVWTESEQTYWGQKEVGNEQKLRPLLGSYFFEIQDSQ